MPSQSFIVSFSNGLGLASPIPAGLIFDDLMGRNLWYLPRKSSICEGDTVLFYQSGTGVRGQGNVVAISAVAAADNSVLSRYGLPHLTVRLTLSEIQVYVHPIELGPLVGRLQFVANKRHWGHSLRNTPRAISEHDFCEITRKAVSMPVT